MSKITRTLQKNGIMWEKFDKKSSVKNSSLPRKIELGTREYEHTEKGPCDVTRSLSASVLPGFLALLF